MFNIDYLENNEENLSLEFEKILYITKKIKK